LQESVRYELCRACDFILVGIQLTQRLKKASEVLEMPVLDHLILTADRSTPLPSQVFLGQRGASACWQFFQGIGDSILPALVLDHPRIAGGGTGSYRSNFFCGTLNP